MAETIIAQPSVRDLALDFLAEEERSEIIEHGRVLDTTSARGSCGPLRPHVGLRPHGLDVEQWTDAAWQSSADWHTYWRALMAEHGDHVHFTRHELYDEFAAAAPPRPLTDHRIERVTWGQLRAWLRAEVEPEQLSFLAAA